MLVQTSEPTLMEDLAVNRYWIAVRRGPAALPATGFRLVDHYVDVFDMVRPLRSGDRPRGRRPCRARVPGSQESVVTGGARTMLTIPRLL